jgi:hypothetical protein
MFIDINYFLLYKMSIDDNVKKLYRINFQINEYNNVTYDKYYYNIMSGQILKKIGSGQFIPMKFKYVDKKNSKNGEQWKVIELYDVNNKPHKLHYDAFIRDIRHVMVKEIEKHKAENEDKNKDD